MYICNFLCHSKNDILVVIRIPVYGTNKQTVSQQIHRLIFLPKILATEYKNGIINNQELATDKD